MTDTSVDSVQAAEGGASPGQALPPAPPAEHAAVASGQPVKHTQASGTPPRPERGVFGLWHHAVSDVKATYGAVNGAVRDFGNEADDIVQDGIEGATGGVRDVAGTGVASVFHAAAQGVHDSVKQTIGFTYGAGEGATEAVGGMVEGVGGLAEDGTKFATDGTFRGQVVQDAVALASQVAHHPVGSAKALGTNALQSTVDWVHGAGEAARNGNLGEYVGKGAASAVVNATSFSVPGVDVTKEANIISLVGEARDVATNAAKVLNVGATAGQAGTTDPAAKPT
ncbi:MAG: hypothetical protein WDN49_07615 [Acetobacteraceae bacterium]